MPRKNYEAVLAAVRKKLEEHPEGQTNKPIYRLRLIFKDTAFLKEVAAKQARDAK